MDSTFWAGKHVFVTGHTGFKGSWLSLWLQRLGAVVTGYALEPSTTPSLHAFATAGSSAASVTGDVRDLGSLRSALHASRAEIVFHLAAQPLVRRSYIEPVETYATNVMGTVHLLEAIRTCDTVKSVVVVTSDKSYENKEWAWGYRESDPMGGYDPYSNSKGCTELVAAAYRTSFFNESTYANHGVAVATARAGNVIGGGDWSEDRLVPDLLRAFGAGHSALIRNPHSVRPWQHVLEPLQGYLMLAQKLYAEGPAWAQPWNFGPADSDARPVSWIADRLTHVWGEGAAWHTDPATDHPHEANWLKLDCSRARQVLGWVPRWNLEHALGAIVEWQQAWRNGEDMRSTTLSQIKQFENTPQDD